MHLAAIWRCWTEPDPLTQWFCPKPWTVSEARIELRVGGEFFTVMNGPAGERIENIGVFLEIIPGERLILTDAFEPGLRPTGQPFMVATVTMSDTYADQTHYQSRAMHWNAETKV